MPTSLQLMKEIRGSLANLFGASLQYVSHWKDASGEHSSDNTMTIAEFNAFTRDIIGVPLQEKMSKVLGYNASVRNSLWQYSQRDNTINKNFFALAVTLRNREVIRGSWDDTREAKFQQLRGNAGDEFPQALLSDMMDYGGKGYKEYDRMRDERTNAGVEKLLDGQTRIIGKLDEIKSSSERNGAKLDSLADWLADWRENGPKIDEDNPPAGTSSNVRGAIHKCWTDYKQEPDKYTPDAIQRNKGQKASMEECLEHRGKDTIYGGETLYQLLDAAQKLNERRIDTFKRLVKSAQANERRNKTQ